MSGSYIHLKNVVRLAEEAGLEVLYYEPAARRHPPTIRLSKNGRLVAFLRSSFSDRGWDKDEVLKVLKEAKVAL